VNVFNLFISVGLSSVAASLGELGKALGALERVSELVAASHPATQDVAATASSGSAAGTSCSSSGSHSASVGAPGHSSNGNGSSSHVIAAGSSKGSSSKGSSSSSSRGASRVELRDVWFKYPGAMNWAVQGINLTIQPGQTVALVGPSGGGKSTIAALLLGLYTPQRGVVLVDGKPLVPKTDGGSGAAEAGMAAVLQQPMLMSGSVRQQIRFVAVEWGCGSTRSLTAGGRELLPCSSPCMPFALCSSNSMALATAQHSCTRRDHAAHLPSALCAGAGTASRMPATTRCWLQPGQPTLTNS
jgi:ABC-type multidrug transport system fused ATPase/permease subunit